MLSREVESALRSVVEFIIKGVSEGIVNILGVGNGDELVSKMLYNMRPIFIACRDTAVRM